MIVIIQFIVKNDPLLRCVDRKEERKKEKIEWHI